MTMILRKFPLLRRNRAPSRTNLSSIYEVQGMRRKPESNFNRGLGNTQARLGLDQTPEPLKMNTLLYNIILNNSPDLDQDLWQPTMRPVFFYTKRAFMLSTFDIWAVKFLEDRKTAILTRFLHKSTRNRKKKIGNIVFEPQKRFGLLGRVEPASSYVQPPLNFEPELPAFGLLGEDDDSDVDSDYVVRSQLLADAGILEFHGFCWCTSLWQKA
ncbi:hypothetical protein DFH08DRAFT_802230 [Mycena albidolilacea]|uniref:Uncharacterized protein n=1 Tax=Mycena albidolilacea TaxID=1033008 RepID=A0AAD7AI81_9AGAR|nr:hypothetical protein DFH08DRAFT_802230 [Mycena albidolilacea]